MVPEKKQDLNIYYIGGNGGFFFFHLLLLSQEYACNFEPDPEFNNNLNFDAWFQYFKETIYSKQWTIDDEWKKNERWPFNELTQEEQHNFNKAKVFLSCNSPDNWKTLPGKKVMIYTDLETELRLSLYKKAHLFHKTTFKGKITSISDTKNILRNTEIIDGKLYRKGMTNFLENVDIKINLHDLIQNPVDMLYNHFNIVYNQDQKNHINHWLSLHPKKLLEKTKLLNEP